MALTDRQRTAESLAREISQLGAWCISAMPLDDCNKLRFQVMDTDRDAIITKLASWGWLPAPCGPLPRVTPKGMLGATIYEIDLPRDRPPVADDRIIHGEIAADRKKTSVEVEGMRRYLGWDK
jgi:hypothetical protein